MPGSLRTTALAATIGLGSLWLAPLVIAPVLATRLARSEGIEIEVQGVWPAWPWGLTAERVVVVRGEGRVEVAEVSARILPSGIRVEGSVGAGTLLFRTRGLTLRADLIRAQSLPLEALDGFLSASFSLRGLADGVFRFGADPTLEATLQRGAITLRAPLAFELPFVQLVIAARREPDGAWRVDLADLQGPVVSGTARGRIDAQGQLALQVEVSRLEEPARSAFRMARLPTEPLPYRAELGGTLGFPILTRLATPAP